MVRDDINEQIAAGPFAHFGTQVPQECIELDQEFPPGAPALDMKHGIASLEVCNKRLLAAAQHLPPDLPHFA